MWFFDFTNRNFTWLKITFQWRFLCCYHLIDVCYPQVEKKGKGKKDKQDAKAQAKAEAAAEAV